MKFLFCAAFGLAATVFFPGHADAASLGVQLGAGATCNSAIVSAGEALASCGSYADGDGIEGRASYGNLGLRSILDGPSPTVNQSIPEEDDFWRGSVAINDRLAFSVESGTLRIYTDIAASFTEEVTGQFSGSNVNYARNFFSVMVAGTTVFQRYHEYTSFTGSAILTSSDDFGDVGTGFVDIAFSGGALDLNVNLSHSATCGSQHTGNFFNKVGTCRMGVDAYNSLRLIGASVRDASGAEVTGGILRSDSGFDYAVGVAPHGTVTPVPAVPVPASLPLLIGGVLLLGGLRRRG